MTLEESFADFREMRDLVENLCQQMYNDLNDGKPSHALRYTFLKEVLEYVKSDPQEDTVMQSLMEFYLENAILTESTHISIETIRFKED